MVDGLPFIFQQSHDQYDTSDLKVSGPLMTSTIAMFGNNSFFHLAANSSNFTYPSVLWQIYQQDKTPFTRLNLLESDGYNAMAQYTPQTSPSSDIELATYLGGWSYTFADTDFAAHALEAGMFFANQALMSITVRVEGALQARPIFTAPGLAVLKPVMSIAQVTIVSTLILVQIVGLAWLIWYIYQVPSWSHSFDSVAVARIGRAMGDEDLAPISVVTDLGQQDLDRLRKVDALIGVAGWEMKPVTAEAETVADSDVPDFHDDVQAATPDVVKHEVSTSWLIANPEEIRLELGGPGLITKRLAPRNNKGSNKSMLSWFRK